MVMDQAGWHVADDLQVPENMKVIHLPPYSPELNPAEQLWEAVREQWEAAWIQQVATRQIPRQAEAEGDAFAHFGNALAHLGVSRLRRPRWSSGPKSP